MTTVLDRLPIFDWLGVLRPWTKTALVAVGYALAFVSALAAVWLYVQATNGPDRDASQGMYAFGDSLVFVAVFGTLATVPTVAAFFFLRENRLFWTAGAATALLMASTTIAAVAGAALSAEIAKNHPTLAMWSALAFPRLFLGPFLAATFGGGAIFAPKGGLRWSLLGAAVLEALGSLYLFLHWFAPLYFS